MPLSALRNSTLLCPKRVKEEEVFELNDVGIDEFERTLFGLDPSDFEFEPVLVPIKDIVLPKVVLVGSEGTQSPQEINAFVKGKDSFEAESRRILEMLELKALVHEQFLPCQEVRHVVHGPLIEHIQTVLAINRVDNRRVREDPKPVLVQTHRH